MDPAAVAMVLGFVMREEPETGGAPKRRHRGRCRQRGARLRTTSTRKKRPNVMPIVPKRVRRIAGSPTTIPVRGKEMDTKTAPTDQTCLQLLRRHRGEIVVVVPAHNEDRTIGSLVHKLRGLVEHVIVVDDGSCDQTAEIGRSAGAQVISHSRNNGKGVALATGFEAARALEPRAVVVIDADGQHCVEELPRLVAPVLSGLADIVIGSRYLKETQGVPVHRVVGHRVFNWITGAVAGVGSSDSQSGYRAFSRRAVEVLLPHSAGFSVESEMQFIAREHRLRLQEVPVTIRYLEPPKRNVVGHGLGVLNGLLQLVGQYRPLLFNGLTGMLALLSGLALGALVLARYREVGILALGYALVTVMLVVFGIVFSATGLILHSTRALLVDLIRPWRSRYVGDTVPRGRQSVLERLLYQIGRYRPLRYIGLPGLALVVAGLLWGLWVVDIYRRSQELAIGYAVISLLLISVGHVTAATGLILHSVKGLLGEILQPENEGEAERINE